MDPKPEVKQWVVADAYVPSAMICVKCAKCKQGECVVALV